MIECDKCSDKLRCTTGKKENCDRGFKLSKCCRTYLASKKEDIIRMLLDVPNEMISDNKVAYNDICPICNKKLYIHLSMFDDTNMYPRLDELKIGKMTPWIDDKDKITPWNDDMPYSTGEPMWTDSTTLKCIGNSEKIDFNGINDHV